MRYIIVYNAHSDEYLVVDMSRYIPTVSCSFPYLQEAIDYVNDNVSLFKS